MKISKRKKSPRLQQQFADCLKVPDKFGSALAARILAREGDERGIIKLRQLAVDNDHKIRFEAVMYLGETADVNSQDLFIKSLKDENLEVRAAAIYALGRTGDSSIVPLLQQAYEEATRYETLLETKLKSGLKEEKLRQEYGFRVFDFRETLQRALETIPRKGGPKPAE